MHRAAIVASLCLALVAVGYNAKAQFSAGGGVGADVTKAYVDAAVATAMAAIPTAASMVPPTDSASGAVGAVTNQFARPDAVRPARYRSSTGTIAGGAGVATITWSTPFATTPNPLGDPAVVNANAATSMIQCNWTSISTTGATVKCVQPLISLSISLGALTLLPTAPNGLVVSATAVQPL